MKYTDEKIKEFAKTSSLEIYKKDHIIVDINFNIAFIAGFKKAQELLSVQGTKPLSEITDEDYQEVVRLIGSKMFGYGDNKKDSIQYLVAVNDYLRSKGYILPTQQP